MARRSSGEISCLLDVLSFIEMPPLMEINSTHGPHSTIRGPALYANRWMRRHSRNLYNLLFNHNPSYLHQVFNGLTNKSVQLSAYLVTPSVYRINGCQVNHKNTFYTLSFGHINSQSVEKVLMSFIDLGN